MDKNKFTEIYDNNLWLSEESASGTGSTMVATSEIREQLPKWFVKYKIETLLDYGCGDFNWMKEVVLKSSVDYLGLDIVDDIINKNREKYKDINHVHFDYSTPEIFYRELGKGYDAILVRDVLVHFSDADAFWFINKVKYSETKYLIATNFLGKGNNNNIKTGWWRDISLMNSPFDFPAPLDTIVCYSEPFQIDDVHGIRYDKTLAIWEVNSLRR
jgi:hypothetical protein